MRREDIGNANDTHTVRTVGLTTRYFALQLGIAVLIGLVPMWFLAHARGTERDSNAQRVTRLQLKNGIANAALDAKRGE